MPTALIEPTHPAGPAIEQQIELRGTANNSREQTLLHLRATIQGCHGFLLEDQHSAMDGPVTLDFEIPRRSIFDLYSGLLAAELDLCRDSHLRLSSLCTLRRYHRHRSGNLTLRLGLTFSNETDLEDAWAAIGFA